MTNRMVGSVLTLVTLLFSVVDGAAQTYTQMQWGMNKGVTPYQFGANINGTWSNLGTVSSAGAWALSLAGGATFPTLSSGASGSSQIRLNSRDGASVERVYTIQADQFGNGIFIPGGTGSAHVFTNAAGGAVFALGQTGQSTTTISPPLWSIYSSIYPGFMANINNYPMSSFPLVGSAYAIVGAVDIPSTGVNPAANFSAGVGGYARTASTTQQAVGVLASGQINTDNGSAWALNTLVTNAPDYSNTPNNGFTDVNMWGIELNFRVAKRASGADPNGNLIGIDLVGNSDTNPLGYSRGIWIQPHGLYTTPVTPWKHAIYSDSGAAQTFAYIGTALRTGASGSQPIKLGSRDGAAVTREYQILTDEFGNGVYLPGSSAGHVFTNDALGALLSITSSGITNSVATTFNSGLTVGVAGTTVGSVDFKNATSGTITLQPTTGALGTVTATLPANTGTIAETNLAQTFTANQTFGATNLRVAGSSTGVTALGTANSSATDYTATLPANTGTIAETNLAQTFSAVQTFSSGFGVANTAVSGTAPTISSGFGTSPSVTANNGTAAFRINVGTGGTATSGVVGLPTVANGWNCFASDITTPATGHTIKQTATSTTSATLTNYDNAGTATAWAASDIIIVNCMAY